MSTIKIGQLRSRLSHYLHRVRRGESITIMDRDVPIARLEPILMLREPRAGAPRPGDLRLPAPLRLEHDPLALLAEERAEG